MPRKNTTLLLEMVAEGTIDKDALIQACLLWMSEDEVTEMAKSNEFLESDYDEDDEMSKDDDHDSAMTSAGWGTDEDYGYSGDVDDGT
jgi:hypothetical protein